MGCTQSGLLEPTEDIPGGDLPQRPADRLGQAVLRPRRRPTQQPLELRGHLLDRVDPPAARPPLPPAVGPACSVAWVVFFLRVMSSFFRPRQTIMRPPAMPRHVRSPVRWTPLSRPLGPVFTLCPAPVRPLWA